MLDIHEAEARKLDRLVFGDGGISKRDADASRGPATDAPQR